MRGRFFLEPSRAELPPRCDHYEDPVESAERQRHAGERYNNGDYTYLQLYTWAFRTGFCMPVMVGSRHDAINARAHS